MIEQLHSCIGYQDHREKTPEDDRSHKYNRHPFVDRHFLANPPTISQVHVNDILILL